MNNSHADNGEKDLKDCVTVTLELGVRSFPGVIYSKYAKTLLNRYESCLINVCKQALRLKEMIGKADLFILQLMYPTYF